MFTNNNLEQPTLYYHYLHKKKTKTILYTKFFIIFCSDYKWKNSLRKRFWRIFNQIIFIQLTWNSPNSFTFFCTTWNWIFDIDYFILKYRLFIFRIFKMDSMRKNTFWTLKEESRGWNGSIEKIWRNHCINHWILKIEWIL